MSVFAPSTLLGNGQHGGGVPTVEAEVLMQLHRGEITGGARHDRFAEFLHGGNIAGNPALELAQHQRLALIGAVGGRLRAVEIEARAIFGAIGFEEHPGEAGVDIGEDRVRVGVGRGENVGGARLIAEEAADEVVDAAERRRFRRAHFISEGVLCHGFHDPA